METFTVVTSAEFIITVVCSRVLQIMYDTTQPAQRGTAAALKALPLKSLFKTVTSRLWINKWNVHADVSTSIKRYYMPHMHQRDTGPGFTVLQTDTCPSGCQDVKTQCNHDNSITCTGVGPLAAFLVVASSHDHPYFTSMDSKILKPPKRFVLACFFLFVF